MEIAGIYDINSDNARRLGEAFGAPVVLDVKELTEKADMVHIFTPPSKRLEYVEYALACRKHIFMEKPAAISLEDVEKMEEAAAAVPVCFMVGFTQRFRRGYKRLWEWMERADWEMWYRYIASASAPVPVLTEGSMKAGERPRVMYAA